MRTSHHSLAALALVALLWVGCTAPVPRVGDSCSSIEDCAGERALACSQGQCVAQGCQRTVECPAGAACANGTCTVPECADHDDCPLNQRCFEGDCRLDLCEFKAECDDGQVCLGTPPQCVAPPSNCEDDTECPRDLFCKTPEGVCERKCTSDASCAEGSYCDDDFCRLMCTTTSDCAAGDVCVGGRCLTSMCGERTCDGDTPFVDPVSCLCVQCLADRDCVGERNERCNTAGVCSYCPDQAASEEACLQQGLVLSEGCCVECTRTGDCPEGTVCASGRCILDDPRDCTSDADCPGARCDLGWCVLPGSMTSCEEQDDCESGEACYSDGRCRAEGDGCEGCGERWRCVAEPGNELGACVGCQLTCDPAGCEVGTLCYVPTGAAEGYCAAAETVSACD